MIAPDGNRMVSRQEAFLGSGLWELGWIDLGLTSEQGEGTFPREEGNRSIKAGRNSSLFADFFRNLNITNSPRRLRSRWDLGPLGQLCVPATKNPSWESDLGRLQSCRPRRLGQLGKLQSSALP